MGRLLGETGARKKYSEKSGCPERFQFALATIRQSIFLVRILKEKIGRSEFSTRKIDATEISRRCQNKETNYYNQKNLYASESFLHT